jgi:hypothetical protein
MLPKHAWRLLKKGSDPLPRGELHSPANEISKAGQGV